MRTTTVPRIVSLASTLFVIVVTLSAATTMAQPRSSPKENRLRPPQLMASENGRHPSPLALSKAEINTVIVGYLAQTTMTMTFRNDSPRLLEGELTFPLPENATISGYALDINGTMVDGVPVERQKARITYEKEIRKRVDPGLVELAVGNNFKTRVYPIPVNGTRTIRVQYVSDVTDTPEGAVYRLPLNWGQVVDECKINVEMLWPGAIPVVSLGNTTHSLNKEHGRYFLSYVAAKEKLDTDLVVMLPPQGRDAVYMNRTTQPGDQHHVAIEAQSNTANLPLAYVEKRMKEVRSSESLLDGSAPNQDGKEEFYFTVSDKPDTMPMDVISKLPTRIGILWDASLSRADADKEPDLAVLRKVLAGLKPDTAVDIIPFRNEPDAPTMFAARDGDAIVKYLQELVYDGGTNMEALPIVDNPVKLPNSAKFLVKPANYDYWLLFTDGLGNLGKEMPAKIEVPVYAISSDSKANYPLLKRMAAVSGGGYCNLLRMTDTEASAIIGHTPYSLMGIDFNPAEVAELYPAGSQPVAGRVMISGRLLASEATITLKYGINGSVMERRPITLKQADATQTGLVPRFWAQQKVADLSTNAEENDAALSAISKEFNLVTPNTSLLVLETVEQYLTYGIVPPKSRGDMYAQFMSRIEQQKKQQTQTRDERLARALDLWDTRVKWWDKKFEYPADFVYRESPDHPEGRAHMMATGIAPVAAPPPPLHPTPTLRSPQAARDATAAGAETRAVDGHDMVNDTPRGPREAPMTLDRPADTAGAHGGGGGGGQFAQGGGGGGGLFGGSGASSDAVDQYQPRRSAHRPAAAGDKGSAEQGASDNSNAIAIKEWNPAVPYLIAMREAGGPGAYAVYLKQRATFASPSFYLDCADFLLRNGQKQMGIRVLTNIAELKLDDAQLLRIVAHKLNQTGDASNRDLAIELFEKIARMRPEEPQSFRDLGLALADRADAALADASSTEGSHDQGDKSIAARDYQAALKNLDRVVMNHWDRFEEIEVIALMEANRIIARLEAVDGKHEYRIPLDSRLVKNLDTDVRIVLTWDADQTDVDLWVTEPSGEKCYYGHNRTTIGGAMSRDFTQGYGPEEYCLHKAMPGKYLIQANYYGSSQQSMIGPCTVQATVITDFGRPNEKRQHLTLRLDKQKDVVDVGTVTLK